MLSDYVLIFLFLSVILLIFLSMKYFKILLLYLWIFLWFFITILWISLLEKSWYNLTWFNNLLNNFENFFKNSYIINFFLDNIEIFLFIIITLVFYKWVYYIIIILLHFLKWFSFNTIDWISNKKDSDKTLETEEKK